MSTPALHDAPSLKPSRAARSEGRLRQRYGVLLAAIVATFMVAGIGQGGRWQEALDTGLAATTLVLALRAGEVDVRLVRAASVAGAAAVVWVAALAAFDQSNTVVARVAGACLVLLAPPAVVVGVLKALREHHGVTVQAVLGVLCVYLLIGLFYASLYGGIDGMGGPPFFEHGLAATTSNCLYFSFATLTTVGYGDVTTATNLGHTLAVGEALVGQIYLVTVVAVLVANLGRGRGVAA